MYGPSPPRTSAMRKLSQGARRLEASNGPVCGIRWRLASISNVRQGPDLSARHDRGQQAAVSGTEDGASAPGRIHAEPAARACGSATVTQQSGSAGAAIEGPGIARRTAPAHADRNQVGRTASRACWAGRCPQGLRCAHRLTPASALDPAAPAQREAMAPSGDEIIRRWRDISIGRNCDFSIEEGQRNSAAQVIHKLSGDLRPAPNRARSGSRRGAGSAPAGRAN
jgi:hypothetical protein